MLKIQSDSAQATYKWIIAYCHYHGGPPIHAKFRRWWRGRYLRPRKAARRRQI